MVISYKHSDDGLTIGIADYSRDSLVSGYDDLLVIAISDMCETSAERTQLLNFSKRTAYARPHGDDTYDEKRGEEIVRNKLIIRDSERQALKVAIMEKYIIRLQKKLGDSSAMYARRIDNGYERLGALDGDSCEDAE